MKKILLVFTLIGAALFGLLPATAQYYDAGMYTNQYNTSNGQSSHNNNYGSYYMGGTGSYTIGCTTYYYNTRTRAQLYTENICSNYYSPTPYYNQNYWYQDYNYYNTTYYTSGYTDTGYGYNYSRCHYQHGYQVCY